LVSSDGVVQAWPVPARAIRRTDGGTKRALPGGPAAVGPAPGGTDPIDAQLLEDRTGLRRLRDERYDPSCARRTSRTPGPKPTFLVAWARRISWNDVADAFYISWESVFRSVQKVVAWGLAHRNLDGIKSSGVDEVLYCPPCSLQKTPDVGNRL
jgi:hypothetical protein